MKERTVKNILVTGGAGFIGSAFIRFLLNEKTAFRGRCINLDLLTYAGNLHSLTEIEEDPRYRFQKGDICDQRLVETLCTEEEIDTIIHFAAESHVDRSIAAPEAFLQTNILGTFHLLEIVKRKPHIHFHHVSTDEVYGALGEEGQFTETTPYSPNSPYSASKAASDHLVRAYAHTYGLSTCLSNCSNNYGPYQFPEKLIPLMLLNCLRKKNLPLYGKGDQVRDWLYVEDHARALLQLLEQGKKGETYNIGGNAEKNNRQVVEAIIEEIAAQTNSKSKELRDLITFVTDRPGHDWRYAIDASKIKETLGWTPAHSFQEGLTATVQWYLSNPEWIENVETGEYKEWITNHYASNTVYQKEQV